MKARVDFAGEIWVAEAGTPVVVGREADVSIDDNPFLHRQFLEIAIIDDLCWLTNLGAQLSATVADSGGRMQAWLSRVGT